MWISNFRSVFSDFLPFTEIIFGLTNLLGFSFAPRIKNFKDQQLYSFNSPKVYHDLGYAAILTLNL